MFQKPFKLRLSSLILGPYNTRMGIYENRQIHTKTGSRPIKSQGSRSGRHTDRMLSSKTPSCSRDSTAEQNRKRTLTVFVLEISEKTSETDKTQENICSQFLKIILPEVFAVFIWIFSDNLKINTKPRESNSRRISKEMVFQKILLEFWNIVVSVTHICYENCISTSLFVPYFEILNLQVFTHERNSQARFGI